MNTFSLKISSIKSKRSGFALIASLTLLSLLAIISTGILSLSSLTARRSTIGRSQDIARANARLGLMKALNELQKELGPDQRINANAGILKATSESVNLDSTSRWVGVWDSWNATSEDRPSPNFRRWLVSGADDIVRSKDVPTSMDSANDIVLARAPLNNAPSGQREPVAHAGLMKINVESARGSYAWWVDDENSKARIGHFSNFSDKSIGNYAASREAPASGDHQMIDGLSTVSRDDDRLSLLYTTESSALLSNGQQNIPAELREFMTLHSAGVIADVTKGRLKRDLSAHLADPRLLSLRENALDTPENSLYQVKRKGETGERGGINFLELASFYNLSSQLRKSRNINTGNGVSPTNEATLVRPRDFASIRNNPYISYQQPTVLSASYLLSAVRNPENKLAITQDFLLTLWNPYDTKIEIAQPTHLTMRLIGIPYKFNIQFGQQVVNEEFAGVGERGIGTASLSFNFGNRRPLVMQPGEVLIFSDQSPDAETVTGDGDTDRNGDVGWRNTAGLHRPTKISLNGPGNVKIVMNSSKRTGNGGDGTRAGDGAIMAFLKVIGDDLAVGNTTSIWAGGLIVDREQDSDSGVRGLGNRTDFESRAARSIFPLIQKNIPASSLASNGIKVPIAYVGMRARTEIDSQEKGRHMSRFSPAYTAYDFQNFSKDTRQTMPVEIIAQRVDSLNDIQAFDIDLDNKHGFFGSSSKADGASRVITHSIPRRFPISIAALQHAHANGRKHLELSSVGGTNAVFHDRILQPSINHAIGNSFAVPSIEVNQTVGTFNDFVAADHSYLANQALWDSWFFSSLDPDVENEWNGLSADRNLSRVFDDFVTTGEKQRPLANANMIYVGQNSEEDKTKTIISNRYRVLAKDLTAGFLMNRGAFNVNSSNHKAWEALLRSSRGSDVPVANLSSGEVNWERAITPVTAKLLSYGNAILENNVSDPTDDNQWIGFRNLTDEEIRKLSIELVDEIRQRGPFLSLSDFINRRLQGSLDQQKMGALQAALDRSVNKDMVTGDRSNDNRQGFVGRGGNVVFEAADDGAVSTASGAYVKQGDILTNIGNSLTVRSDTFVIRSYGDHRAANGNILAKVYLEAVVQRIPDFVNSLENSPEDLQTELSNINKRFGRKFRIQSITYLNEDEI